MQINILPWENKEVLGLFVWASIQKDLDQVINNPRNEPPDAYVLWAYLMLQRDILKSGDKWFVADEFFGHEKTEAVNKLVLEGMNIKDAILKTWAVSETR